LVLWLNQVTKRFSGEPPQTLHADSCCGHYPAPAPVYDFVLLFLPPCGPHLTQLAIGSLESGLLVSPLLGGPARHKTFAPTLHLHQRKSSRNQHLQYSAKSQSTPRSHSLITARSDHPPILRRSGPQPTRILIPDEAHLPDMAPLPDAAPLPDPPPPGPDPSWAAAPGPPPRRRPPTLLLGG
jgi:hypothetical protein